MECSCGCLNVKLEFGSPEPASGWGWSTIALHVVEIVGIHRDSPKAGSLTNTGDSEEYSMKSGQLTRRLTVIAGGAAVIGMISFTAACGTEEEKPPETTTPTTTTTTTTTTSPEAPPPPPPPPAEPTEKSINPTGGNLFSPDVKAPPAPTAIPGDN